MTGTGPPARPAPEVSCVDALLESVLGVLPESLVCQVERDNLRVAAAPFATVSGEAVVELHLGGLPQRDFTARLWPVGAREALAAWRSLPPATLRFLVEWLRSDGPLSRVPYIELEQDIVKGEPLQWVGPATRPDFRHGGGITSTNELDYETGIAVLRALPDWPPPNFVLMRFRAFIEQLPAGVRLNMMSSLGARGYGPRAGLRMILSGPREVALKLASLNEPLQSRAQQLLSRYAPPRIGFDLELVAHGMCGYFAFYRRFSNPNWTDIELRVFLDHACGDALLTRDELDGFFTLVSATHPGDLALTFKLVLRENAPVRLKAYVERLVY